jgi:hypothetical protein
MLPSPELFGKGRLNGAVAPIDCKITSSHDRSDTRNLIPLENTLPQTDAMREAASHGRIEPNILED